MDVSEEQAAILMHHNESRYNECLETLRNGEAWTFQEPRVLIDSDYDGYEYDREVLIPELMHLRRKIIEQIRDNPRAIMFGDNQEWLLFQEIPEMEGAYDVLSAALCETTWEYLGHGQERMVKHKSNEKVREQAFELQQWLDGIQENARAAHKARRDLINGLTKYEFAVREIDGERVSEHKMTKRYEDARAKASDARLDYEDENPECTRKEKTDAYWETYHKETANLTNYTMTRRVCSKCGGASEMGWTESEADGCAQDWAVTSWSWRNCLEGCGRSDKRHHIHSSGGSFNS